PSGYWSRWRRRGWKKTPLGLLAKLPLLGHFRTSLGKLHLQFIHGLPSLHKELKGGHNRDIQEQNKRQRSNIYPVGGLSSLGELLLKSLPGLSNLQKEQEGSEQRFTGKQKQGKIEGAVRTQSEASLFASAALANAAANCC